MEKWRREPRGGEGAGSVRGIILTGFLLSDTLRESGTNHHTYKVGWIGDPSLRMDWMETGWRLDGDEMETRWTR